MWSDVMGASFEALILHANRDYYRAQAEAVGLGELVRFFAYTGPEVQLHVAVAGPEDGAAVFLLHGFPDSWMGWARQVEALVEAGYRVIMPIQRGYDRSDKPEAVEDYRLEALGGDVIGIMDALNIDRAQLVGHDWGGALTWWLAAHRPDRFSSATVLNCPPVKVLARALWSNPNQFWRSWYVMLFQVPGLAEKMLSARDYGALRGAMVGEAKKGSFRREEITRYMEAWRQPQALRGMLSWYRAARYSLRAPEPALIELPMCVIWGTADSALHTSLIEPAVARCAAAEVHRIEGASHWVQRDATDEVNACLLAHLDAHRS